MLLRRESKIKTRWSFKEKGLWIVAKKLHPYPLNLKSKVWNQGEEDGGYEHYLVFLVKRKIKRLWCVFLFFFFFLVFFVFRREEKSSVHPGWKKGARDSLFFLVWSVPRAFYSPGTIYKAAAPSNDFGLGWSWHPWKDLDFLFLKRYGTWKSSNRIKSYGS